MFRKALSLLIPSAVGAGTALVAVALLASNGDAAALPKAAPGAHESSTGPARKEVEVRYDDARLRRLEGQVAGLARSEVASAEGAPPDEDMPPPDPEAERVQLEEMFAKLDEAFERDADDPGWSVEATATFHDGLSDLGNRGNFELVEAECRSAMCRATVQWSDYASATAGPPLYEQRIAGLNCTTSMWLPEPMFVEEAYSAEIYLDCSELRAGKAEPTSHESAVQQTGE